MYSQFDMWFIDSSVFSSVYFDIPGYVELILTRGVCFFSSVYPGGQTEPPVWHGAKKNQRGGLKSGTCVPFKCQLLNGMYIDIS